MKIRRHLSLLIALLSTGLCFFGNSALFSASAPAGPLALKSAADSNDLTSFTRLLKSGIGSGARFSYKGFSWPILTYVTYQNRPSYVSALLSAGADPNVKVSGLGLTALLLAVRAGHEAITSALLTSGANPNLASTRSGETPLIAAALLGDSKTVQQLLSYGAKLSVVSKTGETALFAAVRAGHIKAVQTLLLAGADPDFYSPQRGTSPLMVACNLGRQSIERLLIDNGADWKLSSRQATSKDFQNYEGWTALMFAASASTSSGQIVSDLLQTGADVARRSPEGTTALMVGAQSGNLSAVKALLAGGAPVDVKDKKGETALTYAMKGSYAEIAANLLAAQPALSLGPLSTNLLLEAARTNNLKAIEFLYPEHSSLFTRSALLSALLESAQRGEKNIAGYFRRSGLKIFDDHASEKQEVSGDKGKNYELLLSAQVGDIGLVKSFLAAGQDVNALSADNKSPLIFAVRAGNPSLVKFLLSQGAKVDNADKEGRTALSYSAERGDSQSTLALLRAGASFSLGDSKGMTPLVWAAFSGSASVIGQLFEAGALKKQSQAAQALKKAVWNGHKDAFDALIKNGAAPSQELIERLFAVAVSFNYEKIAMSLWRQGALAKSYSDPFYKKLAGDNLISSAAWNGSLVLVQLLVSAGSDPNVLNAKGETPLMLAVKGQHSEVAHYLLSRTSHPMSSNDNGKTAFDMAQALPSSDLAVALLQGGVLY